jgi:putative membrane protein
LTLANAKLLQRADIVFGVSATLLLVIGLLRVFYFEKGAEYYFANHSFLTKLGLFVVVAALSVLPTVEFLKWRKATTAGQIPAVAPQRLALLRRLIHMEIAGVLLIIACAAMMARGIG